MSCSLQMQSSCPGVLSTLAAVAHELSSPSPALAASPEEEVVTYRRVEPKYCEGCGALRLRFADDPRVLCRDCESTIGEAALSRRARRSA